MSTPIEYSSGPRRRRVAAGEFLVTPVRTFQVNGEQLRPGRDRLSPSHPWVEMRPELFRPCMKGDKWTADRMRTLLRATERELRPGGTTRETERRAGRRAGGLTLPPPPRPLRLP